ncbi:helix-turn-helix domain-containing protein [Arcticibacter tournemirensis]
MELLSREIIGRNVKYLREASGLSQHSLSLVTDLSKRSIANIESGKSGYNLDLLDKILAFFNIKLDELCKDGIIVPYNFREKLTIHHKRMGSPAIEILSETPTIVYAIKFKLINSHFIDEPKEISQIATFFEDLGWKFKGTSISNALKRMPDYIDIQNHEVKKNTHVYRRKK